VDKLVEKCALCRAEFVATDAWEYLPSYGAVMKAHWPKCPPKPRGKLGVLSDFLSRHKRILRVVKKK